MMRLASAVAVFFLLAGCSGSSAPETLLSDPPAFSPPAPQQHTQSTDQQQRPGSLRVGEAVAVSGRTFDAPERHLRLVTQKVRLVDVAIHDGPAPNAQGMEKPANGYFVVVTVQIRELHPSATVNAIDFRLQSRGHTYQPSAGNSVYSGYFASGDGLNVVGLAPGQSVGGVIVFDAPSRHGRISYGPGVGSGTGPARAAWRF